VSGRCVRLEKGWDDYGRRRRSGLSVYLSKTGRDRWGEQGIPVGSSGGTEGESGSLQKSLGCGQGRPL